MSDVHRRATGLRVGSIVRLQPYIAMAFEPQAFTGCAGPNTLLQTPLPSNSPLGPPDACRTARCRLRRNESDNRTACAAHKNTEALAQKEALLTFVVATKVNVHHIDDRSGANCPHCGLSAQTSPVLLNEQLYEASANRSVDGAAE
jgi:hypothetical protein